MGIVVYMNVNYSVYEQQYNIFIIIRLISFIIFRLLFEKSDDDFHRIVETYCLIND